MSGQGNTMNFNVFGETDESQNATIISGIPITSSSIIEGGVLTYDNATNTIIYKIIPITNLMSAIGDTSFTPSPNSDIPFPTIVTYDGFDIESPTLTTFTFAPGTYRLQFSFSKATFGAAGSTESISYQFFNDTNNTGIGPTAEIVGFDANTTTACGVSIDFIANFSIFTTVTVRTLIVSATTPLMFLPYINLMKLNN